MNVQNDSDAAPGEPVMRIVESKPGDPAPTQPTWEATCSVCKVRQAIGVCSIPGMAYSDAFCQTCLQAGAIPYWAAVCNTALCGGWAQVNEYWDAVVWDTLRHLNISPVDFSLDVWEDMEAQDEYFSEEEMAKRTIDSGDSDAPLKSL